MIKYVKRPRLLDGNLQPIKTYEPLNLSITLQSPGVSQAVLSLAPEDEAPPMHAWIELYTHKGSAGIFRVTTPSSNFTGQQDITLRHGIDALQDACFEYQDEFTGSTTQFLTAILNNQTTKIGGQNCWRLGRCECTSEVKKTINYDRLSDLLSQLEEDEIEYYFDYDQSSFPWTLNFIKKPSQVRSEFRLNRNTETITVTQNDNDLCTQLLLSVNVKVTEGTGEDATTTNEVTLRTYNNTAAQAIWGIVQKTADIDTNDDIEGGSFPAADAWADKFLAQRSEPTVQIQLTGLELYKLTGDTWDEAQLNQICRVALPNFGHLFTHRLVSVAYSDAIGDPESITCSLANQLPKFSSSIANLKKQAAAAAAAARYSARYGATQKDLEHWAIVTKKIQEAMDGTGITEMYESGIEVDAETGVRIYSLVQGFESSFAELKVQNNQISTIVQKSGIDELGNNETLYSKITQTADAITSEVNRATAAEGTLNTQITQTASSITSLATKTGVEGLADGETLFSRITQNAESITSEVGRATAAEETINTRITQTADAITTEVNKKVDNTTYNSFVQQTAESLSTKVSAGDIASTINQTAQSVRISAEKIDLDGYVTATELNAEKARFDNLTSGVTKATSIRSTSITGDSMETGSMTITTKLTAFNNEYQACTLKMTGIPQNGNFLGAQASLDLTHYHSITATAGTGANAGKIYFTLGAPQTTEGTTNFNIADTQFYKNGVSAAKSSMGVAVNGEDGTVYVTETSAKSVAITAQAGIIYNSSSHTYTATGSALADGITMASQTKASGTEAYVDGVSSVTVSSVVDAQADGDGYNANVHRTRITIKATASNGAEKTVTFWTNGDEYAAGLADGQGSGSVETSKLFFVERDSSSVFQIVTSPYQMPQDNYWLTIYPAYGDKSDRSTWIVGSSIQIRDYVSTFRTQSKTVTTNGMVYPDSGYDALSWVYVNVSGGGGTEITLASSWSGSGDSQTYTLTGSGVKTKSMTLTYSESAWSNGQKTITVTSNDKPNDNRVFQHVITAPSSGDPPLYYWEDNVQYAAPTSGVKKIPFGKDILVGTSGSNRFWVGANSPNLQSKYVSSNGTYYADSGYDGLYSVTVSVPSSGGADASNILVGSYNWYDSGQESYMPSGIVYMNDFGTLINQHKNGRGYAVFKATISGGTGQKWYAVPIG